MTQELSTLSTPEITHEFLEKVLKKPIKSFTVRIGSNLGDNFTSILYSIDVLLQSSDGSDNPLHLIMKVFPSHPARQQFLQDSDLFEREIFMYGTLVPEYLKLQTDIIGNDEVLKPAVAPYFDGMAVNLSKMSKDPSITKEDIEDNVNGNVDKPPPPPPTIENYILMLDVRKASGFRMVDKVKGLDLKHCELVITELAKLHALSRAYKYHHKLTNLVDKYPLLEDMVFNENNQVMVPMAKANFNFLLSLLDKNPHVVKDNEVLKSIGKIGDNCGKIFKAFTGSKGVDETVAREYRRVKGDQDLDCEQWLVGNHGDCWVNNMLFLYDSSLNPLKVILVDLQMIRESCLTIDLVYLIYTSIDHNLRSLHLSTLLQTYYHSFIKYSSILKTPLFKGFTLPNLQKRFHRSKIFGLVAATIIFPIILQNSTVDLETVKSSNGDGGEGKFGDLIQAMANSEKDDDRMGSKFFGMIQSLADEGIL